MKVNLDDIRRSRDVTLRSLAKDIGKSLGRTCDYMHGANVPMSTLYRICEVLKIDTGDLFDPNPAEPLALNVPQIEPLLVFATNGQKE